MPSLPRRRTLGLDRRRAEQEASSFGNPPEDLLRLSLRALLKGPSHVTSTVDDPVELFRDLLEEQFHRQTGQLSELTICTQQPDRGGYDEETLVGLIVSSRQALTDTAEALRRMAEGTYGTCKRCAVRIPLERLEILPHARFCVPCQRTRIG